MRRTRLLALAAVLCACDGSSTASTNAPDVLGDGARPMDGAPPGADAGRDAAPDASLPDAGLDAARPDATARPDAAAEPDAAAGSDATAPDGGAPSDNPLLPRAENRTCRLPTVSPEQYDLQVAFPALAFDRPLWVGHAPGEPDTMYVVEQSGRIVAFDARDDVADADELVRLPVSRAGGEEGLLGLAFHPGYAHNGRFYVYYSAVGAPCPEDAARCSIVSELTRVAPRRAEPASERRLLVFAQPFSNHNGGDLHFGADGYLYVSSGDGGSGGDPFDHAQDTHSLLGKILRIDVDPVEPDAGEYAVPLDNPFADGLDGRPEVWAWGLRNPWRMRFDPADGALWVGDVGQDRWEEIDVVRGPGNFGWNVREGLECFADRDCDAEGLVPPIHVYGRAEGRSVTGGLVYRGPHLPELAGAYLFADYSSGNVWSLRAREGAAPEVTRLTRQGSITSFGTDAEGQVYLTSFAAGRRVLRLVRRDAGPEGALPERLSETGCFADTAAHRLAPGVVPYGVTAPLWSDGAEKLRYLALPPGEQLGFAAEGAWAVPVGSVLIKTFHAGGRRLETRMLARQADGWRGYTWRWNAEQTDAFLLPGGLDEVVDTPAGPLAWRYPARTECDQCHTAAAGHALGLRTRQLNGGFDYGDGPRDQLATLAEAGYATVPAPSADLPAHPRPDDAAAPLEARARAYLDANCASCHQPAGPGNANIDLRAEVPLAETGLCDAAPAQGDLGVDDARLVAPGAPDRSVLLLRMARRGAGQMPPLATGLPDDAAVALVRAWIEGLRCP